MTLQEFVQKVEQSIKSRYSSFGSIMLSVAEHEGDFLVSAMRKFKTEGFEMSLVRKVGVITARFIQEHGADKIDTYADTVIGAFKFRVEDATENLVGKHGYFMWTGMMVGGTITKVYTERECSRVIEYEMDHVNHWGSDVYHRYFVWARVHDNFGPLQFTVIG